MQNACGWLLRRPLPFPRRIRVITFSWKRRSSPSHPLPLLRLVPPLHVLLLLLLLLHLRVRPIWGSHSWGRYWVPCSMLRLSWRRRSYSAIVCTDRGVELHRNECHFCTNALHSNDYTIDARTNSART